MKDEDRPGVGNASPRAVVCLSFLVALAGPVGCGTNAEELLYQTTGAAGRTYLDLLLTDLANAVADRFDRVETASPPTDDEADEEEDADLVDDGDDVTNGDGSPFDDLTGDPTAGEPLCSSCAACHCADASGGCIPGATALVGVSAETLDEFLRGDAAHPSEDLTDQEVVDLEAYLASPGG